MNTEQGLIANLLVSPEYIKLISLLPEDFTDYKMRNIYSAMQTLEKENCVIDVVSLAEKIKDDDIIDIIKQLIFDAPLSSEKAIMDYERLIKESNMKKNIKAMSKTILQMIELGKPFNEIQSSVEHLSKSAQFSSETKTLSAYQGVLNFQKEMNTKKNYIPTGISKLDDMVFIDKGDYIVIGGRPSAGKTAFALQLAKRIAKKLNVVFFSLETKNSKIIDRMIVNSSGVDFRLVKKRQIENGSKEENALVEAYDEVSKLKFMTIEAAGFNVAQIKSNALMLKADVIFIDYLGLIQGIGKDRYEKVTNISTDLHTMSQTTGITTIALSQLNRTGTDIPKIEHLRESGQIEQDADAIILLHYEKKIDPDTKKPNRDYTVIVAKNKEGTSGRIDMKFFGETQKFLEVDYGV